MAAWRPRNLPIRSVAIWMAFTPLPGFAECAARPWQVAFSATLPLCPTAVRSIVGSPTMQNVGRWVQPAMSSISERTPTQPISSSYEKAICSGMLSVRRAARSAARNAQARNPFMSAAPRANRSGPRACSRNGSELQR